MRHSTLIFVVAAFALLTLSRLALALWQWQRVRNAGGLAPLLLRGLRIDAHQIAVLAALPAVLSPLFGHIPAAAAVTSVWYLVAFVLLAFLEVATPPFIIEYDSRPNRLFVEYLKHPREVSGMLWRGYKGALLGGLGALAVIGWAAWALLGHARPDAPLTWWQMPLASVAILAVVILAIRGTLSHRPINPSSVAYCADGMLNTLALNSLYNVFYAVYSMKNEKSASAVYGGMDDDKMHEIVLAQSGLPYPPPNPDFPSLHPQPATRQTPRPLNLVIILEESLGAQYSAALGGADLTPELDALAREAWTFTRAYATGTRSVRGLEAVTTGFLPTPAQAVLKLPRSQRGFFSLADLLGRHGYHSRFIYGGESHFDNMKGFFLGNGFREIVDRPDFVDPAFVGTWGASDEDMFNQLDRLLREDGDRPSFTLAFSVSNHSPWEYPEGRIQTEGNPATVENTVRYADWALGRFFERAKASPYWENTVFLVAADHDSRVFGASLVPVRHFHIPAVILGAGIAARRDDRLISQIDLPPTLLSLIGVDTEHPMIGHDLTRSTPGRAIMQYDNTYGYLKGDDLLVLAPNKTPVQYRYTAPEDYAPVPLDAGLATEALAHALWPSWAYREGRYCLPSQAPVQTEPRTQPAS
ncbi:LTA synthase family protein [Achromobacter sp. NFACC18-2]|uniref:LTA synthase family protein n=1 Tax=Achromobacter sp. NFACC18-2 TaxID=1564112 RepID=UPI0008D283D8|nr:LTA synthase family protein [Achromobacter sp. NFACC18-2]SEJ84268.1 Phosphoglycerol transferase MdoB [Achromobacter sp. NFACC18-2]